MRTHTPQTLLGEDLLATYTLSSGQSDVGRLSPYHPVNKEGGEELAGTNDFFPNNVTTEFYRGVDASGMATIGSVAIQYFDKKVQRDRQFVDVAGGIAGANYFDLSMAESHFGSNTTLYPLTTALGLQLHRETTDTSEKVTASAPLHAHSLNEKLLSLGITDRSFIDFDGSMYTAEQYLTHLAHREILLASDDRNAVHDRLFHLIGHVLLAPKVFDRLVKVAQELVADFNEKQAVIGDRPFYEFDGDEPKQYFNAKRRMEKLMGSLDFNIPNVSFQLSRDEVDEQEPTKLSQIAFNLKELGVFGDDEVLAATQETVSWKQNLIEHARTL